VGDPDDFCKSKYPLRAHVAGREIELFIVVTMYNEDELLFARTWKAIRKNIAYLCSKNSDTWGEDGWKKVCVAIISDGREKINQKTLNTLGMLGCYQEGHIKTSINGQPVSAHVFEYTSQVTLENSDVKV
jgi:chitin synthase